MLPSVSLHQLIRVLALATLLLNCTLGVLSHDEKAETCCHKVSRKKVQQEILDCIILPEKEGCLAAVLFITEENYYCSNPKAQWVQHKLKKLAKNHRPCKNSTTEIEDEELEGKGLYDLHTDSS